MTAAAPASTEPGHTELPRALTLRDMVLFNIVAVVSLRWMATAAAAGPSTITLWLLAGLLFFIPQGLAVSDLAARYPEEGGIYVWTKRFFGEGHGFMCGWCYWVNNILYYPNLLISTAVVGTYAIGHGESGLADKWAYVLPATLGALWLATGLNIVGLKTGRWLQNLGALGTYLPGLLLIGLGVHAALTRPVRDADERHHPHPGHGGPLGAQSLGVHRLCLCRPGALRGDGCGGARSPAHPAAVDLHLGSAHRLSLYRRHRVGALADSNRSE